MTVDVSSLLVRVVESFDHELDRGVTLTYKCRVTSSDVTSLPSCHASVVINDVDDEAPHIRFSNSTTAKYDRLTPIQVTGKVHYDHVLYTRNSSYITAVARLSHRNSVCPFVCPSVRPSHEWITKNGAS